jgi:hypothetical protein
MGKTAKIALTVAAAGGALVAGFVLLPKMLHRSTVTPAKPAPMTNAPAQIPATPATQPATTPGGTLGDINAGISIANGAIDVLQRLGLGNDDGGISIGGFSF